MVRRLLSAVLANLKTRNLSGHQVTGYILHFSNPAFYLWILRDRCNTLTIPLKVYEPFFVFSFLLTQQ